MNQYKSYDKLDESFFTDLMKLVKDEFFCYYYLFNLIDEVLRRRAQYDEAFIIMDSKDSWIVGFSAFGSFLLYGNKLKDRQIDDTVNRIHESNIKNGFHLSGTFDLLQVIRSKVSFQTETFKERIFYCCKAVVPSNYRADIQVGFAEMKYHQEITKMVCEYFEYEYKGKNNKDFSEMFQQTFHHILSKKIWQIINNQSIVGFCSVIESSVGLPIVGSFFIQESQRNKGYGTLLLENVTLKLLTESTEVWLMSDKNEESSNKIFLNLGYAPVYQTGDYIVLK